MFKNCYQNTEEIDISKNASYGNNIAQNFYLKYVM